MSRQLPADCLNEIFEYLEDDKINLRPCLLVNRLYCEIAVKILWRNIWSFHYSTYYKPYRTHVPLSIISTLIACLPNESKDLLHRNRIFIATPTQKPPLFNYASFCKILSFYRFDQMIQYVLEKQPSITPVRLNYSKFLLSQEIFKLFMNQITSLKILDYTLGYSKTVRNILLVYLPGAKDCLTNLRELSCGSDMFPEFFYQISQICRNIQSLTIEFNDAISDGLSDLIALQNDLKSVTLKSFHKDRIDGTENIISSLTKFSSTLTKLTIEFYYTPLSFISMFTNLQELTLILEFEHSFDELQYITFPKLRVLNFFNVFPRVETLTKFLEINGKNLKEFYVGDHDNSLNLAIAKYCPNLKILSTVFMWNELEALKLILNSCKDLENIGVWCGGEYLNDKLFLEILAKYSPENFYEIEIYYRSLYDEPSEILPEDLEEFFTCWKNRKPQKSLSFVICRDDENTSLEENVKNMKIIERYMKMGLIKKFRN